MLWGDDFLHQTVSNDNDIDIIKLYEALGRSIVFAMGKMKYKYNRELEWMTFYDSKENGTYRLSQYPIAIR